MEAEEKKIDSQKQIDILVVDDDVASQTMLEQVLGSEGWRVRIVTSANQGLQELAAGSWAMVVANLSLVGSASLLFATLQELALSPNLEPGMARLGVIFVVPLEGDPAAKAVLEAKGLQYVAKPFHLHEFLERVSDLLIETGAISAPIRRVRQEGKRSSSRFDGFIGRDFSGRLNSPNNGRNTMMFSGRSDYSMTEEEIVEFEKQEAAETERKKKKKLNDF